MTIIRSFVVSVPFDKLVCVRTWVRKVAPDVPRGARFPYACKALIDLMGDEELPKEPVKGRSGRPQKRSDIDGATTIRVRLPARDYSVLGRWAAREGYETHAAALLALFDMICTAHPEICDCGIGEPADNFVENSAGVS